MLVRQCAGGVVFHGDKVFLLQNEKGEWVLPKGVIRGGKIANEVALTRVRYEGGVNAQIISSAGETSYEFYSYSRRRPVCNRINWFVMEASKPEFSINRMEGFKDGGFYPINEALEKITYSQDQALVRYAYKKYREYLDEVASEEVVG
ncbi:MAG: NUDIX hydrolase [Clostridia bacterium]|nr:NUDIX hydrolase [Clostridia bacterium]